MQNAKNGVGKIKKINNKKCRKKNKAKSIKWWEK